jgi:hypothetical protein
LQILPGELSTKICRQQYRPAGGGGAALVVEDATTGLRVAPWRHRAAASTCSPSTPGACVQWSDAGLPLAGRSSVAASDRSVSVLPVPLIAHRAAVSRLAATWASRAVARQYCGHPPEMCGPIARRRMSCGQGHQCVWPAASRHEVSSRRMRISRRGWTEARPRAGRWRPERRRRRT